MSQTSALMHQKGEQQIQGSARTEDWRARLEEQIEGLKKDIRDLKEQGRARRKSIRALKKSVSTLQKETASLQRKFGNPMPYERILLRKLLDRCRQMAHDHLRSALPDGHPALAILRHWNKVLCEPTCVDILNEKGLDGLALVCTDYLPLYIQKEGDRVAHTMFEPPADYAEAVLGMVEPDKVGMVSVFKYVFGKDPLELWSQQHDDDEEEEEEDEDED